jgi:two-component system NtrC family sensor kinase
MQRRESDHGPAKRLVHTKKRKARRARAPATATNPKQLLNQHTRERDEALEQQAATSEILTVISRSPANVQPVLDTIVRAAVKLCNSHDAVVLLRDSDRLRIAAHHGPIKIDFTHGPINRDWVSGRCVLDRVPVHVHDLAAEGEEFPLGRDISVRLKQHTVLAVPFLRDGEAIGSLTMRRREVLPFSEKQIALLRTFSAQAVIAIENTRLFEAEQQRRRELSESLEQQTATSEVLKVISSSPSDLQPVFDAMLVSATQLCQASYGTMWLQETDGQIRIAARYGNLPVAFRDKWHIGRVFRPKPSVPTARVFDTREPVHVVDLKEDPSYFDRDPLAEASVEVAGIRSLVSVPMLKEDVVVGTINVYRREVRPFTHKEIALVQNFAAQAVIAIENARLLSELRESLEQQIATADVLKVISRSTFDLQTVLDTLVESATRRCEAQDGFLFLPSGDVYCGVARYGFTPEHHKFVESKPIQIDRGSIVGRTVVEGQVVHVPDVLADPEYTRHDIQKIGRYRAVLGVPLLREAKVAGVIFLSRSEARPFTDKQIELVRTFADQAVIAIENARLLNELRESLQQQTATADVLKVISRSTFDLQMVLRTLTESAAKLCAADKGVVFQRDGELYQFGANSGFSAEAERYALDHPIRPDRGSIVGRVALSGRAIHLPDVLADPEYRATGYQKVFGYRTNLGVPLLREGTTIGVFSLTRDEVKPFTEKQIELATTFADQAGIAIENARLLSELRESLQQQTATAEVLKVISRSAFDLLTVLDALLQSAARLCDADQGTITQRKGDTFFRTVSYGFPPAFLDYVKDVPVEPGRETGTGRALAEGKVIHIPDVLTDPDYSWGAAQKLGGFRTLLGVPMLRDGDSVGVLTLTRTAVRPFTDKQIELVSTFADQAAIAIENVRLFEAEQRRTRELAQSLEDLRTAQDRLVQTEKLASLGQLTAGIAHEIKNPLNFVNNFSSVSVELIDELQETLQRVAADEKTRADIAELSNTLRDNLRKIMQHGRRADSIIKNMLLHSRQGPGERRPTDINTLVEDSLNLAYHGARAEKQGFNITLQRFFDPGAGEIEVFPQEITRVLLNLIGNGFYAAAKRRASVGAGFEPTLAAATKNLGDRVEISIRDNGAGIPPEVREKMFNPFFTTKPAGEGTGLGLSLSHDIIVKQHSGSIDVDTEPGAFTEFRIVLPRTAAKQRSQ